MHRKIQFLLSYSIILFSSSMVFGSEWDVCSSCTPTQRENLAKTYVDYNSDIKYLNILDLNSEEVFSYSILGISETEGGFGFKRTVVRELVTTIEVVSAAEAAFEFKRQGSVFDGSSFGLPYTNAGYLANPSNARNVANVMSSRISSSLLANVNAQAATAIDAIVAGLRSTVFIVSYNDNSSAEFKLSSINQVLDEDGAIINITIELELSRLKDGNGLDIPMTAAEFSGITTIGNASSMNAWNAAANANNVTINWEVNSNTVTWQMSCTTVTNKIICTAIPTTGT